MHHPPVGKSGARAPTSAVVSLAVSKAQYVNLLLLVGLEIVPSLRHWILFLLHHRRSKGMAGDTSQTALLALDVFQSKAQPQQQCFVLVQKMLQQGTVTVVLNFAHGL